MSLKRVFRVPIAGKAADRRGAVPVGQRDSPQAFAHKYCLTLHWIFLGHPKDQLSRRVVQQAEHPSDSAVQSNHYSVSDLKVSSDLWGDQSLEGSSCVPRK